MELCWMVDINRVYISLSFNPKLRMPKNFNALKLIKQGLHGSPFWGALKIQQDSSTI